MNEAKLKRFEDLFKVANEGFTKDEFIQSFDVVIKMVKALQVSNATEFSLMHGALDSLSAKMKEDNSTDLAAIKKECEKVLEGMMKDHEKAWSTLFGKLTTIQDGEKGEDGKDGADGKDAELETAEQIVTKINDSDVLISKSAVEGLAELEEKLNELGTPATTGTRAGWGAHPLTIQSSSTVVGKTVRNIKFTGATVTTSPDGVVTVAIPGAGGTAVYSEDLTSQAPGTAFTLANTPIAGTVRLYRGGTRQRVGAGNDYTISGKNITFLTTVSQGEIIEADYVF